VLPALQMTIILLYCLGNPGSCISRDPALLEGGKYTLLVEPITLRAPGRSRRRCPADPRLTAAGPYGNPAKQALYYLGHAAAGDAVSIRADWLPGL